MRWLPESARRHPDRDVHLVYRVVGNTPPRLPEATVAEALHASSLKARGDATNGWRVLLPHRTWVYGLVRREVDEMIELRLIRDTEGWRLSLVCSPQQTHQAHAAGVAGVVVMAATVWVAAGIAVGAVPAATTVLAGVLLVEITRQWGLTALERRLHRLVGDVGSALWPELPAAIVPYHDTNS